MYAKSERRLICIKLQRLTIRVLILDNSEKKTNTEKKKNNQFEFQLLFNRVIWHVYMITAVA